MAELERLQRVKDARITQLEHVRASDTAAFFMICAVATELAACGQNGIVHALLV